jgi:hypothetical protein
VKQAPRRHSGTVTHVVAFLRMLRASFVADAGSWLKLTDSSLIMTSTA